ncbi:hypothetical protein V6N11_068173 [Hibiscus sabdariffa]|uniref:Uncharacterized protein n=1 Tax=Hibiscus sabdariffa TaxID=183260 RepID=A0ABR2SSX2_9ROSI
MQILDPEIVGYTKSLMLMVNHELDGSLQNHYNVYGGQQLTSHYTIGTSGSAGVYLGAGVEQVAGMLGAASTQRSSV